MAPVQSPPWVVKDITSILMLDEETVKQMIVPELEKQNIESRLKSHLQDFLGSSQAAKAFISRYLAYRFPSINNTPSSTPNVALAPDANLLKAKAKARAAPPHASVAGTASGSAVGGKSMDVIAEAFGPGGKVYMKNRDADDAAFQFGRSSQPGMSRSGSSTSAPPPRQRQAGAMSINYEEAKIHADLGSGSGKGKKAEKIWDMPKSREVKKIEGIIANLRNVQQEGPKPGNGYDCFCQARMHPLSPYTPICGECALIICNLHAPHLPCPSCGQPLYSQGQLTRLIFEVEKQLEAQLSKENYEEMERERERREKLMAESGGGAFPTLAGAGPLAGTGANTIPVGGARKVMTIAPNPKGKGKATVTTTTYRTTPPPPPPRARTPPPENIMVRPRSAFPDHSKVEKSISKLQKWRKEENRPWGHMKLEQKGEALKYVETSYIAPQPVDGNAVGRRKKGKIKKEEERQKQRVVPGAAPRVQA